MPAKIAAGNWKMNGSRAALTELDTLKTALDTASVTTILCPPYPYLMAASERVTGSSILLGAQDCHAEASGAFTGDISAPMLVDAGASHVILGHSERRDGHGETDVQIAAKCAAAQQSGLSVILCIGESQSQRDAGRTLDVLSEQLAKSLPASADAARLIVAYEPIWAIGTGAVATTGQIAEVHAALRQQLTDMFAEAGKDVPILYGGSVKPANAAAIFATPHVNGALVGGASLKAADFLPIIGALENA